jgi:hypothetical protein
MLKHMSLLPLPTCSAPHYALSWHAMWHTLKRGVLTKRNSCSPSQNIESCPAGKWDQEYLHKQKEYWSGIKPRYRLSTWWSNVKKPHLRNVCRSHVKFLHKSNAFWSNITPNVYCTSIERRSFCSRSGSGRHTDKTDKTDKIVSKEKKHQQQNDHHDEAERHTDKTDKTDGKSTFKRQDHDDEEDAFTREARRLFPPIKNEEQAQQSVEMLKRLLQNSDSDSHSALDAFFDADAAELKQKNDNSADEDDSEISGEELIKMLDEKIHEMEESEQRVCSDMKRTKDSQGSNQKKDEKQVDEFLAGLDNMSPAYFVRMNQESAQSVMNDVLRAQALRAQHDEDGDDEVARPGWLRSRNTQTQKANTDQTARNSRGRNTSGGNTQTQSQNKHGEQTVGVHATPEELSDEYSAVGARQGAKCMDVEKHSPSESELSVGWLRVKADQHVRDNAQIHDKMWESGQMNPSVLGDGNSGGSETLKGTRGGVKPQTSSSAAHERQTDVRERDKGAQGGVHKQTQTQTDRHDTNAKEEDGQGKVGTQKSKTSTEEEEDMSWLTPEWEAAARKVRLHVCMYACMCSYEQS